MKLRSFACALALSTLAVVPAFVQQLQEKGGEDETGPYDVVADWPKPLPSHNADWGYGTVAGVFAESPDRVFVVTRGDWPKKGEASQATARKQNLILVFNRKGDLIENWSQWDSTLKQPHSIYESPYDPERRVWLVDNYLQQILMFSNDGKKLLMTLGEADKAGTDKTHFGRQADIAWFPDGSFVVADGYDNTRIIKFDKTGKYVMDWGVKGSAPGQLDFVHGIGVDGQRRVYEADRRNSRIQVFDESGKFIEEWRGLRSPSKVVPTTDGAVWVCDGTTSKILKYDRNGHLLYSWGTVGTFPGGLRDPHSLSVDQEGNLYIADYQNHRVQKFIPKKNADKTRLMQRQLGFPPIK
jgi:DNA-binding beta-propeller fold protein YncE